MNKFYKIVLLVAMLPSLCFGDCDWSLGIKPLADGNYEYSKVCHEQVGTLTQQITDLNKAIDLKNEALKASDERTQLWMDTSFKMEDKLQKVETLQKSNDWLYFGLGALTIILTGFATASLTHRN